MRQELKRKTFEKLSGKGTFYVLQGAIKRKKGAM
jgi:hypothetical protein